MGSCGRSGMIWLALVFCAACGGGGGGGRGADAGASGGVDDDGGVGNGTGSAGDNGGASSGSGSGAVPADSGLMGSKKASELTDEEAVSLCGWMDLKAANAAPLDAMCTSLALDLTEDLETPGDASTCEGFAEQCVERGPSPDGLICVFTEDGNQGVCIGPDPEADAEEGFCTFEGCEATVAEIEACTRVLVSGLGTDVRADRCSAVGDGSPGDQAQEQAFQSAACMTVLEKCPDFL